MVNFFEKSFFILFMLYCSSVYSEEKPNLPYVNEGACPFEGCIYGAWKATEKVTALKEPKDDSSMAFTIDKGESVKSITGFVITIKAGITKIIKPLNLGFRYRSNDNVERLNLKPGDFVYTLHYLGEGFDLFWYRGVLYTDQISDKPTQSPAPDSTIQVISSPEYIWWVKVINKDNQVGWLKNPPYFEGSDQFAYL